MRHIVLHFKLYTAQIRLYIYFIPNLCGFYAYVQYVSVCMHMGVCVCAQCVHSVNERSKCAAAQ